MEKIIEAFDNLLSNDKNRWKQAHYFLYKEVLHNPKYIIYLKKIYMTKKNSQHKILSLIMIKNIVINCFKIFGIEKNIQRFCEIIEEMIQYSLDSPDINSNINSLIYYFNFLEAIVNQFSLSITKETKEVWGGIDHFLVFYRTDSRLIPFCINLYLSSCQNDLYSEYLKFQEEINPEIIFCGLQFDDIETQLNSIEIFSRIFKNVDEGIITTYQDHFEVIYQIAGYSFEINEINPNF